MNKHKSYPVSNLNKRSLQRVNGPKILLHCQQFKFNEIEKRYKSVLTLSMWALRKGGSFLLPSVM